jgi:hypothetical protein
MGVSRFQFGLAMSGGFSPVCSTYKLGSLDEVAPARKKPVQVTGC